MENKKLNTSDMLFLAGHICGALSVFLLSVANIWKVAGQMTENTGPLTPEVYPGWTNTFWEK